MTGKSTDHQQGILVMNVTAAAADKTLPVIIGRNNEKQFVSTLGTVIHIKTGLSVQHPYLDYVARCEHF